MEAVYAARFRATSKVCLRVPRTIPCHVTVTTLVTGFEAFGQLQVNPSALIVDHVRGTAPQGMLCEVLRTEFIAAEARIRELIRAYQPATAICVGVAPPAAEVRLERLAVNLDNARLADNAGYQPVEIPIVPNGRLTLSATLPLERMHAALVANGIPASISDDAGRFVCNHVYYAALDEIARDGLPTRCGFIHVPLCTGIGNADDSEAKSPLGVAELIAAVERCIAAAAAPEAVGAGTVFSEVQ